MYKIPTSRLLLESFAANDGANTDEKDIAASRERNLSTTIPADPRRLSDLSVPSLDDDDDSFGDADEEMASINGTRAVLPLPLSPRRFTRAIESIVKRSGADKQTTHAKRDSAEATNDVNDKHLVTTRLSPLQISRITDAGVLFAVPKEQKISERIRSISFVGSTVQRTRKKRKDTNISERRLNRSSHI